MLLSLQVSAGNKVPLQKLSNATSDEAQKLKIKHDEFNLTGVSAGRQQVQRLKKELIPTIRDKIQQRFNTVLSEETFKAFRVFNTTEWFVGDDEESKLLDFSYIDSLMERFQKPLSLNGFDIKLAKSEWKKVDLLYINVFLIIVLKLAFTLKLIFVNPCESDLCLKKCITHYYANLLSS